MKRKTYRNFMLTMDLLQDVKHYSESESIRLAHQVWDNVEHDRGRGNRSAEYFIERIMTKEDYMDMLEGIK